MTDLVRNQWHKSASGWTTMVLAASLVLSVGTWFLASKGQVNYFPTYIAALAALPLFIKYRHRLLGRVFIPAVTLIVWLALTSLWSPDNEPASVALTTGYAILLLAFVLGIAIVSQEVAGFATFLIGVCVAAATASALLSLWLFHSTGYTPLLEEDRLYGLGRLGNPVVSALTWAAALTLSANCVAAARGLMQLVWVVCAIVLLIALTDTLTRSVWPALFVSVIFAIARDPDISTNSRLKIVSAICLTVFGVAIALFAFTSLGDMILRRSTSFRPEIWRATLGAMQGTDWLIGHGINASGALNLEYQFVHAHSVYFATLYHAGLVGLALLAWLAFSLLWDTPTSRQENLLQMAILFGLAVLALDGDRLLEKFDHHWIVFWLPVALLLAERAREGYATESNTARVSAAADSHE